MNKDNNLQKNEDNQEYIFRPYYVKNGVRIYPKKAKVFKIPVKK